MTLDDLLTEILKRGTVAPSRTKDLKTSVRYLTQALAVHPAHLANDAEALESPYRQILRTYFASLDTTPSPHTIRNTLNNLSFLYRTARACELIHTVLPRPTHWTAMQARQQRKQTSPYRERSTHERYQLPVSEWPAAIREPWQEYLSRRELTMRPITMNLYERSLKGFVAFGLTIDQPPMSTWDDIFNVDRVRRYIRWHAARMKVSRISPSAYRFVSQLITFARESQRPETQALVMLKKQLPKPEPMHNKQHPDHNISLKELEDVGLTMLANARKPPESHDGYGHGRHFKACRHRTALILRLLVRVPLRLRNLQEMQLGQNLYQDHSGTWQIRFQGDELKVRTRNGRINIFHIPFPPDLVEHLEEHLRVFRPILLRTQNDAHVFLSRDGRIINHSRLGEVLSEQVYFHTGGKRFYPHLIRTIWTDTYLLKTHDISTAAFMLNDRPDTVLQRYHELRANDHIQKAYQFSQSLFGT
jgi:hypothetical protein